MICMKEELKISILWLGRKMCEHGGKKYREIVEQLASSKICFVRRCDSL